MLRTALRLPALLCAMLCAPSATFAAPPPSVGYPFPYIPDLDKANGVLNIFNLYFSPVALGPTGDLSLNGGDATLLIRATTLANNGFYDAAAPYHPTAVGAQLRASVLANVCCGLT
jgi:hypothetical protein